MSRADRCRRRRRRRGRLASAGALESCTDNDDEIRAEDFVKHLQGRIDPGDAHDRGMHRPEPLRRRLVLPVEISAPLDVYGDVRRFLAQQDQNTLLHFLLLAHTTRRPMS